MVGLRNVLVHGYGDVDDQHLFHLIQQRLGDIEAGLAALSQAAGLPRSAD